MNTPTNEPAPHVLLGQIIDERLAAMEASMGKAAEQIQTMRLIVLQRYNDIRVQLTSAFDMENRFLTNMGDITRIIENDLQSLKEGDGLGPQGKALIEEAGARMKKIGEVDARP